MTWDNILTLSNHPFLCTFFTCHVFEAYLGMVIQDWNLLQAFLQRVVRIPANNCLNHLFSTRFLVLWYFLFIDIVLHTLVEFHLEYLKLRMLLLYLDSEHNFKVIPSGWGVDFILTNLLVFQEFTSCHTALYAMFLV